MPRSSGGSGGRPSLADVASEAGVSVALASFALNDRDGVSAETKTRILEVAAELGYRANPHARALRTGATHTLGLLVRNLSNPYFLDVISGAEQAAVDADQTILVVDADYSLTREEEHLERLATRVDALAIAPVGSGASARLWQELRPGTPLVIVNATTPGLERVARVGPDNVQAVELAVRHLHGLGHTAIAFLTAPADLMADHDRLDAFRGVCAELNITARPVETQLNVPSVYETTLRLLRRRNPPTALITNSDYTAYGVYKAARAHGARIGRDLSVVGHDDLATSELLDPPLTTLRIDARAVGRAVVERLVRGVEIGDHHEPVELVKRRSTRRAPRS